MADKHQNDPIRVGVIGLGFAGETALKCYSILPNVQIVALAGLEEERLAQLGTTFAIPHLYRKYEDLLARADLDAVSIGVPNHLHAPVAIAALERLGGGLGDFLLVTVFSLSLYKAFGRTAGIINTLFSLLVIASLLSTGSGLG